MIKKILLGLAVLLVVAQFIRPEKNRGSVDGPNFVGVKHPVPPAVAGVLQRACYDCHSNHTVYPCYAEVQPVGWWLAWHISNGKRHLNFSEFGTYNPRREAGKLKGIVKLVRNGAMPLPSFTWMHPEARLTPAERQLIIDWAEAAQKTVAPVPPKP